MISRDCSRGGGGRERREEGKLIVVTHEGICVLKTIVQILTCIYLSGNCTLFGVHEDGGGEETIIIR